MRLGKRQRARVKKPTRCRMTAFNSLGAGTVVESGPLGRRKLTRFSRALHRAEGTHLTGKRWTPKAGGAYLTAELVILAGPSSSSRDLAFLAHCQRCRVSFPVEPEKGADR